MSFIFSLFMLIVVKKMYNVMMYIDYNSDCVFFQIFLYNKRRVVHGDVGPVFFTAVQHFCSIYIAKFYISIPIYFKAFFLANYISPGRGAGTLIGGFLISSIGIVWTFRFFGITSLVFAFLYLLLSKKFLEKTKEKTGSWRYFLLETI